MSAPFENPVVRYGIGLTSAAIVAVVALAFLDGTIRWLALGIAAFEAAVVPQLLKRAVARPDA